MPTKTSSFYGWKLAALLFVGMAVNTALPIYALGLLNVYMADELDFSRATLGTAFAIFMLMTGLPGPLTAKLIEHLGNRWTMAIGNGLLLLGAIAMATIVHSAFALIAVAGLAIGAASAIGGPIPIQSLVTSWFTRRRGLAMGLVLAGGGVTGMVFPPLLDHIVSIAGWRSGWWIVAVLAAVLTGAVVLFVRNTPEDIGQVADGVPAPSAHETVGTASARVYQTEDQWAFGDVLRCRTFWLLLACSTGVSAVYTIFYAQAVLQIRDLGYSTRTASYLISMSVAAGFITHLVISFLGDRVDPKRMWALCLLSQGLGIGLFASGGQPWLLYPGIILIGIGNSGSILCLIMTFSNWFGAQAAPVVFGFGSAFSATCGALAPVASGYSYDLVGSFAPVCYVISAGCIMGSLMLAMTRPPRLNHITGASKPLSASS